MRKIMVVFVAVLPVLAFIAGCGSGGSAAESYNPNEKHVYIHQDDDPIYDMYLLQQMQRQSTQDFQTGLNDTMKGFDDSIRKMGQNNRETLGILEGARMQDELYRQQQLENMRRAYGR